MIFILSFLQTVTFAMASRARNRDHMAYAFLATFIGNIAWFICFKEMDLQAWDISLMWQYAFGAGIGGAVGMKISMVIEKMYNASTDAHLGG